MRRADVAMYTAKSGGGAGVAYYDIDSDLDYQGSTRRRAQSLGRAVAGGRDTGR